jgi:hypothetical protein
MGTWPQTPEPPVIILFAQYFTAVSCPAYFAATSLHAGPTFFHQSYDR